ncbi:transposon TX1 [Tanacetum coccineum]
MSSCLVTYLPKSAYLALWAATTKFGCSSLGGSLVSLPDNDVAFIYFHRYLAKYATNLPHIESRNEVYILTLAPKSYPKLFIELATVPGRTKGVNPGPFIKTHIVAKVSPKSVYLAAGAALAEYAIPDDHPLTTFADFNGVTAYTRTGLRIQQRCIISIQPQVERHRQWLPDNQESPTIPNRLGEIEVKLLGNLEVMVVTEDETTTANVLNDTEHGLRRWAHKLRRGDSLHRTSGRITWINILGVAFTCWSEVSVVEEAKDIVSFDIQEIVKRRRFDGMQLDEEECGEVEESNNEGGESSEDEDNEGYKVVLGGGGGAVVGSGDRNDGEDEASRFSGETRVRDSFEGEFVNSKVGDYGECKESGGDVNEKRNVVGCMRVLMECGDLGNTRGDKNCEESNVGCGLKLGSKMDKTIGPDNKKCSCTKKNKNTGPFGSQADHGVKELNMMNINNKQCIEEGTKEDMEKEEELVQDCPIKRRDKREISPSGSMGSGGGKTIDEKCEGKKKIGRRSVTKAIKVARKTEAKGLGENKKGVSDAYKEYYEEGSENNGIFHFGNDKGDEADSVMCDMNMEQVKKIREMIGIIKNERPDVIGIQETKCGMVDDIWVDDLWGGQGYGYSELHVIKNSEGMNGKNEDVFLVCIYGPHVSRQKASLWERLLGMMNRWQGAWFIFGDINMVKPSDDRLNSQVNIKEMMEFNDFINNTRLIKIPMGGGNLLGMWSWTSVQSRLGSSWLDEPDFSRVVEEAWRKKVRSIRPDCIFRDRLKNVKASLRIWSRDRFGGHKEKVEKLRNEAMNWELEAEKRVLTDSERNSWMEGGSMVLGKNGNLKGCNASFITIIPKVADPIGLGDFRPISLIGCYYKIIAKILSKRVKRVVGNVVAEVQNAFIKGRFILDGVLISNETMDFLKKKKERGLIFKVNFEKAYDIINWRFLLDIMKRMGFEEKWCKWVDSCLRSSSMSILVNGSPSEEFVFERGVRQGDSLSPFLFILATEGLNAIVTEAVEKVNKEDMADMARWLRCGIGKIPFTYLGLPTGENMRRVNAWASGGEEVKNRFSGFES